VSEIIKIGTRGSELALAQAAQTVSALEAACRGVRFELVTIRTKGDHSPGAGGGAGGGGGGGGDALPFGVGVFVREIEAALLDGRVELAIHSLKDVPTECAAGTTLAAMPERADCRDVLISRGGLTLGELPPRSRVGTMSARRRAQLLLARPDLEPVPLRGNLDTRLRKLDEGRDGLDAIIVAAAGLERAGRSDAATEYLDAAVFVPAAGQGALAVQGLAENAEACGCAAKIDHGPTRVACEAERMVISMLECGCRAPVGVLGRVKGGTLDLAASVLSVNEARELRAQVSGPAEDARALAERLTDELVRNGAGELIAAAKEPGE